MPAADQSKSFLLTTWEGGGSVAPALTVAAKLVARGHRVRVMSDECNRRDAEATGASFVSWTRAPNRADRDRASEALKDWQYEGPDGLRHVLEVIWAGRALDYARDVIEELRREPADLVATSEHLLGVGAGCEAIGQTYCNLLVNVSIFPMAGVPPVGPGLAPARTEAERAMHAEITAFNIALFDHGLPHLNAARDALGLAPLDHLVDQVDRAGATLIATARAFDFAPDVLAPGVRYVGPQLGAPLWVEPWTSPFAEDDARPLVLVGFSTTFQNHVGVVQRVLDAAADLPIRLVVTRGGSIEEGELVLPANARAVHSAPHDAVMREAAFVVTHGGHGTVARALSHQRPMLVIPHGRDQNDNAVRVVARGAGLSLPPQAEAGEIRKALQRLIAEPGFAAAARSLGAAVAEEARNSAVCEALEELAADSVPLKQSLCAA